MVVTFGVVGQVMVLQMETEAGHLREQAAQPDAEAERQRAGQLHHWGVVIGMVLAGKLAAERSAALGGLSNGSIVRLDQFRHQLGGVGPGEDTLVDF